MGFAVTQQVQLETHECGECGVVFAAPSSFWAERRNNGIGFYCPNGHNRVFRESEVDKLRKRLSEQVRTATEMTSRAVRAENNLLRMKKRAKAGVCPCCNRTVQALARHMKTKHPNFK